jgi:rSAM/selenodomain-associated transferase 1
MLRPVIIVMVKAPRAGLVKTRLMPRLSANEAAELAACFALDVVDKALRVVPQVIVTYAPADGRAALEAILQGKLLWLEQRGADLGARIESAIEHASSLGFGPIIVTGTDSPTLPHSIIETARDALAAKQADITLGPTTDGGYYLVGLRKPVPDLFQNIDWSTPHAYEQTARNAAQANLRPLRLPTWYDVDTFTDLLRLRDEILADNEAQRRAPATTRWLLAHDLPSA